MFQFDGFTEVVGLFGYPVKHTLSPPMHNAAYRAMGLNIVYLAFEVEPERLLEALKAAILFHWKGLNLTIPFKEKVLPFIDEITPEAHAIGAVNTIKIQDNRLIGYNTDGGGFYHSLKDNGVEVTGKKILILGAGGAARAIVLELVHQGSGQIMVANRTLSRARQLVKDISPQAKGCDVRVIPLEEPILSNSVQEANILINATSVGLHPRDSLLISPHAISPPLIVCDLIYSSPETPLLRIAGEKGCRSINGQGMLLYQGAQAIKIWTGKEPPVELMRKVLEEEVAKIECRGSIN